MNQWYYYINGKTEGPISENALRTMFESGVLALDTLVWDCSQSQNSGKWEKASETKLAITDLLLDVILYIIAKSDQKDFSKTKLEKYLMLLDKQQPIGITIGVNPQYKSDYVVQLGLCLAELKSRGLISGAMKRGKNKAHIYDAYAPAPELPERIGNCLNKLILEYDRTTGSAMP